jgi:hypothetical protein
MSTKALYDAWGPHQRVTAPDRHFEPLVGRDPDDWQMAELIGGVWTIFPHVSIASFDAAGKVYMVSQLFPGDTPETSRTLQTFLHTLEPDDTVRAAMADRMAFNYGVVNDEDYYTGKRIQRALRTGAKQVNLFGRNEGGGQRFHTFLDEVLATDDADLAALFKAAPRP